MGEHPGGDLEEEGVVVAGEVADSFLPLEVGHAPDLVDPVLDPAGVIEVELVLVVGELEFEVVAHLEALDHPEDDVAVGGGDLLVVLGEDGHLVLAEVGLGEGPQLGEGVEDFAVVVVQADFLVDGEVAVDVGAAAENAEVGVLVAVGLLGLEFVVEGFDFEIVEEDDVADFEVEGEILLAVAPEVDLEGLLLLGVVDDFEFLGEVPIVLVAVDVGAVDDEADGREQPVAGLALLVLFLELGQGKQLPVLLHFVPNYYLSQMSGRLQLILAQSYFSTHLPRYSPTPPHPLPPLPSPLPEYPPHLFILISIFVYSSLLLLFSGGKKGMRWRQRQREEERLGRFYK